LARSNLLHEAGHAVVLLALGRPFRRITPRVVSGGRVGSDDVMIHLAGVAAEAISGADGQKAWASASWDGDMARKAARERLAALGTEPTTAALEAELQAQWREVLAVLRRHWGAVEAIADELVLGKVDYEAARRLFARWG
jgi:hypothetical protein